MGGGGGRGEKDVFCSENLVKGQGTSDRFGHTLNPLYELDFTKGASYNATFELS